MSMASTLVNASILLGDDYVKFLRFAQLKMDGVTAGVVGVITNRGFLDNVTFRGMRQSLQETFDQIFVLDLGGASGSTFNESNDDNVFDITVGVTITILVKAGKPKRVRYRRLGGSRIQKYEWLAENSILSSDAMDISPRPRPTIFLCHTLGSSSGR